MTNQELYRYFLQRDTEQVQPKRLEVALEVVKEWESARKKYDSMDQVAVPIARPHYGHSVIKEELEELWDLVKAWPRTSTLREMRFEALQVAAMAMAFISEVCDAEDAA